MSKGLKLTLVTVAVALMGMSAMAEAPVISDIPSPIVGGGPTISPSDTFVYPDAINLNKYVTDDGGLENVVWSYTVEGTAIYNINGTEPIDLGTDDPIDPAATDKDLGTIRNSEKNPDAKVQTITVRNVNLSPYGGPDTDPGDTGILDSETQVVTLFASDVRPTPNRKLWSTPTMAVRIVCLLRWRVRTSTMPTSRTMTTASTPRATSLAPRRSH